MFISKTSRYAIQAATVLAERGDGTVRARELAEATGVPKNYLAKILHRLAQRGVLTSERGASGGFRLATDPSQLSLADIIEPVDPGLVEQQCLLGRPACGDDEPCPAHERWKALSTEMRRFLEETSLSEIAGQTGGRLREPASPRRPG